MSLLDIANLQIDFPTDNGLVHAVRGVNLNVEAGERVAIVGESGSGKSVTARAILGLLGDDCRIRGRIMLDGRNMVEASAGDLAAARGGIVGMVFQEPLSSLNPVYTIGAQFRLGLTEHGLDDKKADELCLEYLRKVDIPDPETAVKKYPMEFSGGQIQRIMIAMALALHPKLIIADEPTTALDVTVQLEILDLLKRQCAESGAALLMISHNMAVVADIAQRVVVMRRGSVVEEASVEDLFTRPRDPYTKQLIASVPKLEVEDGDADSGGLTDVDGNDIDNDIVVQANHINVFYKGRRLGSRIHSVQDVSFEIHRGEILGLVGESGSGKSTIGRALIGLGGELEGELSLLGTSVVGASKREMRALRERVGFIFQDPGTSFNPRRTVGEGVAAPLRIHRPHMSDQEVNSKVRTMLEAVSLDPDYVDRYPHELSGGQRQRASIARSLMLDPELIIADEPTSALDVTIQAKVLELLKQLHAQLGFSCLFISHDLAVVDQMADRVIVLHHGKLEESGVTGQVLHHPQQPYTRKLISSVLAPNPENPQPFKSVFA
ncbi:dipeptide ABC transporter ATP-binding protein [Bifidobacterium olomucense]|uniref:ABC transporter ATP-binding protein n=1 Tax=Bifidobacterium olomucense TaxID=2675324 RepID=A0A7Y0EXX0_9BIFI|nr:ABC transporter ATP-binding protein [Bifidobacterium sp. DSM 109959]NMM98394.1 ABC transporter ATP-binding protein [Bifidobacterium sp. DSM 109959]